MMKVRQERETNCPGGDLDLDLRKPLKLQILIAQALPKPYWPTAGARRARLEVGYKV